RARGGVPELRQHGVAPAPCDLLLRGGDRRERALPFERGFPVEAGGRWGRDGLLEGRAPHLGAGGPYRCGRRRAAEILLRACTPLLAPTAGPLLDDLRLRRHRHRRTEQGEGVPRAVHMAHAALELRPTRPLLLRRLDADLARLEDAVLAERSIHGDPVPLLEVGEHDGLAALTGERGLLRGCNLDSYHR